MAAAGDGFEGIPRLVVVLHVEIAPDPDVFGILLLGAGYQAIRDAELAGRIVGTDFRHVAADGGHRVIFLLLELIGADAAVLHPNIRYARIAQIGISHTEPAITQRLDRFHGRLAGRAVLQAGPEYPEGVGILVFRFPDGVQDVLGERLLQILVSHGLVAQDMLIEVIDKRNVFLLRGLTAGKKDQAG